MTNVEQIVYSLLPRAEGLLLGTIGGLDIENFNREGAAKTMTDAIAILHKLRLLLEPKLSGEQEPQLPQAHVSLSLPPRSEVEKWFTGQDTVEDKYWHEAPYRTNGDVFEQVYDALEYYMRGGNAS